MKVFAKFTSLNHAELLIRVDQIIAIESVPMANSQVKNGCNVRLASGLIASVLETFEEVQKLLEQPVIQNSI